MNENLTSKNKGILRDIIEIVLYAVIIYALINIFIFTSTVHQTSMYPTFQDGDFVVATRSYIDGKNYEQGDVVLFKNSDGRILIKRVIGVPGDTLEIKDGGVYINNVKLEEEYINDAIETTPDLQTRISENCYFVMGDNRVNSIDSRAIGEINVSQIIGKVRLRVFPNPTTF